MVRQYLITYTKLGLSWQTFQMLLPVDDKAALESELKYLRESPNYNLLSVEVTHF